MASAAEMHLTAGAGYQYDSNVGLAGIDDNTGDADSALLLSAGIGMNWRFASTASLRLKYDFTDTRHEQFTEFDLAMHHLGAELGYRIMGVDTSLSVDTYRAGLDGEPYLAMTRISPAAGYLFGTHLYVRGAWSQASKQYSLLTSRDADVEGVRGDVYWIFDGMRRYLALGIATTSEDAADPEFDFDGTALSLTYGQQIDYALLDLDLRLQLQSEQRDYLNVTSSIDAVRYDERLRASFIAGIPFSEHFELQGQVDRVDNRSNLESAELDEVTYSMRFLVSF